MPDPAERPASPHEPLSPTLAEIVEVFRPQVERIEEGFTAIRVALDALAEHVAGSPPPAPVRAESVPVARPLPPAAAPSAAPARAAPARAATPVAPKPEPIGVSGGDGGNWSSILFGENLHAVRSVSHLSGSLLADVYAGDSQAVGFAGQLMTFRTGTAEQKARLLKDVGEAFYAWKPHGEAPLLEPLIDWVHAELDEVQLGNRIMVVQVGDRYDMQRHHAKQPGIEVAEVYGWVILRDNGKVFSKASVAVR
jgi:hypothetical protein